jgi:large subunit ribosomal protein L22
MAEEDQKTDSQPPAEESAAAKPAGRRGRGASAEPAAGAGAGDAAVSEKPKRIRRPTRKAAEEAVSEATPAQPEKPRRTRVRAEAAEPVATGAEEASAEDAPKPRRLRARQGKVEEGAATAPAALPAPKPSPRAPAAAKKPPAQSGGPGRRLVPGRRRASKDAPPQVQLVHAHARYVRSSARKARLVCDHIRGKSVPEARAILAFAPRGVAKDWAKLLDSAVANAEHNHELIADELHVKAVTADVGPTLKRFRPRAMGRATPINKRTAHLSITLAPKE